MKDVILLASYVPDKAAFTLASRTLDYIRQWFKDAHLIVPMNPPYNKDWIHEICDWDSFEILKVPEEFAVDSDASSCLWGLKHIKEQGIVGERLWFAHTKSVTRGHTMFIDAINGLYWSKRYVIQHILDTCPQIGAVSPIGGLCNTGAVHSMEGRCSGPHTANALMALHSFMVWRWDLLTEFLTTLDPIFFEKRLTDIEGMDRYFVERDLATIPSLYGKVLAAMHLINHFERHPSTESWNKEIQDWAVENDLGWMPTFEYDGGVSLNVRGSQLKPLIQTSA